MFYFSSHNFWNSTMRNLMDVPTNIKLESVGWCCGILWESLFIIGLHPVRTNFMFYYVDFPTLIKKMNDQTILTWFSMPLPYFIILYENSFTKIISCNKFLMISFHKTVTSFCLFSITSLKSTIHNPQCIDSEFLKLYICHPWNVYSHSPVQSCLTL